MHSQPEHNYIPQLSIDCVIFGYQDKQLKVLLPKLDFQGDFWLLPSGYISQEEGIDEAARRILEERTGLRSIYLDQFRVFGNAQRTNRQVIDQLVDQNEAKLRGWGIDQTILDWITRRFVSIGYYALVDINKVIPQRSSLDKAIEWYPIGQLPTLLLDHHDMVKHALSTLRLHLDEHLLAFNLLPETFTMKELQELYEAIFDKPFARNNFQKKMLDMNVLERLEKKFTGAANKAPYLYRWQRPEPALA